MKNIIFILILFTFFSSCKTVNSDENRKVVNLIGNWEITKTEIQESIPQNFSSHCQVPGLIDMASPSLDKQDTAYKNSLYWYKKVISIDNEYDISILRINKAKFHTRIYVNGKFAGENPVSFAPTEVNIKPFLNKNNEPNELIISIGCMNNLPDTIINGFDFEKIKYIPGIYDDVSLILTNKPFITYVQTVPDIKKHQVRVFAKIDPPADNPGFDLKYIIREVSTGKKVAGGKTSVPSNEQGNPKKVDFTIDINDMQLWSPESPFLYELQLLTSADSKSVKFGMRSFRFDDNKSMALLNETPYYLRGTNICMFRFFEDPARSSLPWDKEWAVKLLSNIKMMKWNIFRTSLGPLPDFWYDLADSMGVLIQNEYAIWTLDKNEMVLRNVNSTSLTEEYRVWMHNHINHPAVVIWDAQNESRTDTTLKALRLVRNEDLSDRPWDNGFFRPDRPTDCIEAHPYPFWLYYTGVEQSEEGYLKDHFYDTIRYPSNTPNDYEDSSVRGEKYPNPIIINEYGWIWLNRDGTPTQLTKNVYDYFLGEDATPKERFEFYGKNLGILTEFWRSQRLCAGVLEFCVLGYSRSEEPIGFTSDHFIDLENQVFEPNFLKYVKPAFNPVGIMLDFWDKEIISGTEISIPVAVINDLSDPWQGKVLLSIDFGEEIIYSDSQDIAIKEYGKEILEFAIQIPEEYKGQANIVAEISTNDEKVKSIREVEIK